MRNLILFDDDENWRNFLPLTLTKPISELRIGICTIKEKWEQIFNASGSYITQDFLAEKYAIELQDDNVLINSSFLPTKPLILLIEDLNVNEAILYKDELVCARLDNTQFDKLIKDNEVDEIAGYDVSNDDEVIIKISKPHHIFELNGQEIIKDYARITKDRKSEDANETNTLINKEQIFIEKGATINCSILNASNGPIYIGKDATIMEGSIIQGPFAMLENAVTKMGAKIYSETTLGPYCKVGGEINNVVMEAFSSKAHDGYLGNSVIGKWCNIGAGTSVSNLKNNYDQVKVWSYHSKRFEKTGLTFHGLIMGDHSKIAINSMINTGTVIGVSCNIYGAGFPRNFIPSFSWGGHAGFTTYNLNKAFDTAELVMARRGKTLDELDKKILNYIFLKSAKYRTWE